MWYHTDFPEGFQKDNKIIVYVVLSFVVKFLLMLNFMLASKKFWKVSILPVRLYICIVADFLRMAVVVDSYSKVKKDIKLQETDSYIFSYYYRPFDYHRFQSSPL